VIVMADFGLSIKIGQDGMREIEDEGALPGTFSYLPAEIQVRGVPGGFSKQLVDIKTLDVYAIGVTAFELIYGIHPFGNDCIGHEFGTLDTMINIAVAGLRELELPSHFGNDEQYNEIDLTKIEHGMQLKELLLGLLRNGDKQSERFSVQKALANSWAAIDTTIGDGPTATPPTEAVVPPPEVIPPSVPQEGAGLGLGALHPHRLSMD